MKKIIFTIVLTSLVILTHCDKAKSSSQSDTANGNVAPKKMALCKNKANVAFDLETKIQVLDVADPKIAVSSYNDRVFVYGRSLRGKKPEMLVRIFDKNLESVGEKVLIYGQGPGEVGATNILSLLKDSICISVNTNYVWNIYDADLNFLRVEKYKKDIESVFQLEENGSFFVDSNRVRDADRRFERYAFRIIDFPHMKDSKIIYNTNWFTIREEGVISSKRPRTVIGKNSDHSFFYKNGYVYILLPNDYQILKVSLDGKISKNIVVDFEQKYFNSQEELDYLKEYRLNSNRFIFNKIIPPASCTIPLDRGFIVTRRKDYHINCSGEIEGDYFSYDLESKGKVNVPCFFKVGRMKLRWMLHTYKCEDQKLYLVNEEDEIFFLEKWRVIE